MYQENNVTDSNRGDVANREEIKSDGNNITKELNVLLEDIQNNGKTTKSISVTSLCSNINLKSFDDEITKCRISNVPKRLRI